MRRRLLRALAPALALALASACAGRRPPSAPGPEAPSPAAPAGAVGAGWSEEGTASWYGGDDGFEGKPTASGEIYDSSQLTAAHRQLPLGTVVDVTNLENGKTVRVRINDRGPFRKGRILDLSQEAARRLDVIGPGVAPVRVQVVSLAPAAGPVSPTGRWAVQVGSFAEPERAERHAERVRAAGHEAFLEPWNGLSRVKVGPFSTREEARETLVELEAAGFEGIVVPQ
ncbi:MAG: septal ring lytic transglycosylase RlpA family protein [Thermoanaerobaculia bacterium]